jgi:ubiquinone/menaquinone biosynthesis C-methylase UbiE
MADDRLYWILEDEATESLESRYDTWAATYDANNDQWGWRGPDLVVEAAFRFATNLDGDSVAIDAGCGTGQAGVALRKAGWSGRLIGLDFSQGMLDVAASSGAYDELVKCSLLDISLPTDSADVVVSSGVFTHGHVGGEALSELCRVTKAGGVVTVTQRVDFGAFMAPHAEELRDARAWEHLERSEPAFFHPDRDEIEQVVESWRVLG